ncbi:MAG TPA: response regulator [Ktedonobacterales bacterium]|jgi:CheY-like chemotaxis protein
MGTSRPTVLIVDDDPMIRRLLVEALSLEGYPVETASDGGEALTALKKAERHRVVLLDLLMPGVDGWGVMRDLEATPEVRARHRVILMSALSNMEQDKTRALSVDGRLNKPFTIDQLLSAIDATEAA